MASTGTVIVNVYTSDARIPLDGATVTYQLQSPPYQLLAIRVTDRSGQTQPLSISAADREESQAPESVRQPWTGLIIQVEHPEYERLVLTGVQVFAGVTSIQNVQLIPLAEHDPALDGQQDFSFTPQPVWEGRP